jgi:tetratricopeptide (TPR) repeat protein
LLGVIISDNYQRPAEGEQWRRLSAALLDRLGDGNERLRSWLLNDQGIVQMQSGQLQEALRSTTQALALKRKVLRPDDPDIGRSLINYAEVLDRLGDDRGALVEVDEALRLLVAAYGPNAVIVALALSDRGEYLAKTGRFEAAQASFQDALSRWQAHVEADNQFLAYPLTGLGQALLALGRAGQARAPLERAWKIREAREPSPAQRGNTAFALARALWETGHRRRARELAQTARSAYEIGAPLHVQETRDVDLWLARHS